jgi:hypothetical protein
MGFDGTFVLARWHRPLQELSVNGRLDFEGRVDEEFSWARSDGWQCLAPAGGYYDGELLPPVEEIQRETGGPVLGMGIARSDHFSFTFVEGGKLRRIARGPYDGDSAGEIHREMVEHWGGPDWAHLAALSLVRWAEVPLGSIRRVGLYGAIVIPQLSAEDSAFDLLKLLTLVPDPDEKPWWTKIPEAVYAIEANDLAPRELGRLRRPPGSWGLRDLAVTVGTPGSGVWSLQEDRWVAEPSPDFEVTLSKLQRLLIERGWQARSL